MNKEELSNAISDYQKLCRGNYGAILDEIERKQNDFGKKKPTKVIKVGRNDPCPCGSGKKYKKCCGK